MNKLNANEKELVKYIWNRDKITVQQLVNETYFERSNIYRMLMSLQYKGYLTRISNTYPQQWTYQLGAKY